MYTITLYILSSMSFLIDRCDLRVVTSERERERENGFVTDAREKENGTIVSVCMRVRMRGRERGGNTWVKIIMRRSLTDVDHADCQTVVRITYVRAVCIRDNWIPREYADQKYCCAVEQNCRAVERGRDFVPSRPVRMCN